MMRTQENTANAWNLIAGTLIVSQCTPPIFVELYSRSSDPIQILPNPRRGGRVGRGAALRLARLVSFAGRGSAVRYGRARRNPRLCPSVADLANESREFRGRRMGAVAVRRADCGVAGARRQGAGSRAVWGDRGGRQPGQRGHETVLPPAASGALVWLSAAVHLQFSQWPRLRVFLFLPVPGGDPDSRGVAAGGQTGDVERGTGVHADHRALQGVPGRALPHGCAGRICGGYRVDYANSDGAPCVAGAGEVPRNALRAGVRRTVQIKPASRQPLTNESTPPTIRPGVL